MTQVEKILLKKDLCMRLPYDVRVWHSGFLDPIELCPNETLTTDSFLYLFANYEVKPYLRPMLSMSELELNMCVMSSGLRELECPQITTFQDRLEWSIKMFETDIRCIDWLLAHHFDFRGLIERGLAIEAPETMYIKY